MIDFHYYGNRLDVNYNKLVWLTFTNLTGCNFFVNGEMGRNPHAPTLPSMFTVIDRFPATVSSFYRTQCAGSLRTTVQLSDSDSESIDEWLPDLSTKTITVHQSHSMHLRYQIIDRWSCLQYTFSSGTGFCARRYRQISPMYCEAWNNPFWTIADRSVDTYRTLVLDTILPEVTGREFSSNNTARATDEGLKLFMAYSAAKNAPSLLFL